MKFCVLLLLCVTMSACSDSSPKPAPKTYEVTFAVALLPDSLVAEYGGTSSSEKGYNFVSLDDRYRLAAHVLENTDKFPVARQDGGWIPLVQTGGQARMQLSKEKAAETFSLKSTGVSLDRFNAMVAVDEENASGSISCSWGSEFSLTLEKPVGGSTGHGGNRNSGYALRLGKSDMTPLFNFEGKTLWMIVGLRRQN